MDARDNEVDTLKKAKLDTDLTLMKLRFERSFNSTTSELSKAMKEVGETVDIISAEDNALTNSNSSCESKENSLDDSIQKSSIFDLDKLKDLPNTINNLDLLGTIGFTLLMGHTLILSIVVNLLFIYFGDQFINKFKLEERYPKIRKVLDYRRKFQRFYTINGIILIIITSLTFIFLAINILIV